MGYISACKTLFGRLLCAVLPVPRCTSLMNGKEYYLGKGYFYHFEEITDEVCKDAKFKCGPMCNVAVYLLP